MAANLHTYAANTWPDLQRVKNLCLQKIFFAYISRSCILNNILLSYVPNVSLEIIILNIISVVIWPPIACRVLYLKNIRLDVTQKIKNFIIQYFINYFLYGQVLSVCICIGLYEKPVIYCGSFSFPKNRKHNTLCLCVVHYAFLA